MKKLMLTKIVTTDKAVYNDNLELIESIWWHSDSKFKEEGMHSLALDLRPLQPGNLDVPRDLLF